MMLAILSPSIAYPPLDRRKRRKIPHGISRGIASLHNRLWFMNNAFTTSDLLSNVNSLTLLTDMSSAYYFEWSLTRPLFPCSFINCNLVRDTCHISVQAEPDKTRPASPDMMIGKAGQRSDITLTARECFSGAGAREWQMKTRTMWRCEHDVSQSFKMARHHLCTKTLLQREWTITDNAVMTNHR